MTVYVATMHARYGRMIMCHMITDTEEELHAMADKIGVAREWYQGDHYDLCQTKKKLAMAAGAQEISWKQLGEMVIQRRRRERPHDQRIP